MLRQARQTRQKEIPRMELEPTAAVYNHAHSEPYEEAHPIRLEPVRVPGGLDPTHYDQRLSFLYIPSNPVSVKEVRPWDAPVIFPFDLEREDEYLNPTWVTHAVQKGDLDPTPYDQGNPGEYMQKAPDTGLSHMDGDIIVFPRISSKPTDPDPYTPYSA